MDVAIPLLIVLALTKKGADMYRTSCSSNVRLRFGISKGQVDILIKNLGKRGFGTGGPEVMVLPESMMNRAREQYQSKYLVKLGRDRAKELSDWHTKVLVVTDADIYDVGTRYVVGQAELDGRSAVVSISRIRAGDEKRSMRRLMTEALHELGHTIGLRHCRDKDCVMFSSKKLPDSDIKSHEFCDKCDLKVGRALRKD